MLEYLKKYIENKKVLILGFGAEGKSTYKILKEIGGYENLAIADAVDIEIDEVTHTGENYQDVINDYDIVIKSPGVPLKNNDLSSYTADITSQMNLFVGYFKNQIIGITGTKGKSTVSSLVSHTLKEKGYKVAFGGNIGIPAFDLIKSIDDETFIVLEMGVPQLEHLNTSPHVAVILNFFEDHLDRFKTMVNYTNAKLNIAKFQSESDYLFFNEQIRKYETTDILNDSKAQQYVFDKNNLFINDLNFLDDSELRGLHNLYNVNVVYEVLRNYNISVDDLKKSLSTFKALKHRLELFQTISGVDYYNDSISTTAESAISSFESIPNAKTIVIGGTDRGINYDYLIEKLINSNLDNILLTAQSGLRIYNKLANIITDNKKNILYFEHLEECAKWVSHNALENSAVIFSPAAPSYGYFKNFEERGESWISWISEYTNNKSK